MADGIVECYQIMISGHHVSLATVIHLNLQLLSNKNQFLPTIFIPTRSKYCKHKNYIISFGDFDRIQLNLQNKKMRVIRLQINMVICNKNFP